MRYNKKRHIFNGRARRKRGRNVPAQNRHASPQQDSDDLSPLPAAMNDNDRLTPRQRGYVRDADRISDQASGRTVLMDAVLAGNIDLASRILRSGADVNRTDKAGQSALHHAIKEGSATLVALLLERGANPNLITRAQDTPLLMALAKAETAPLAMLLLDAGADVTQGNKSEILPLHAIAQLGPVAHSYDLLTRIVEATPDPNRRDGKGATALHYAVRGGHQPVLEKLLYHRLDPLATTHEGQTCLHEAAARHDTACATTLLQGWAVELLNAVNHDGRTPLHIAIDAGHEALAQEMMTQGALTNTYDTKGMTPLHIAAKAGKTALVHLLLENGATLDASEGKDGASPLLMALRAGQRAIARELLAQGADANRADNTGVTPMMAAAENSMYDIVDIMLEQGGNAALKDKLGRNVLHWCGDGLSTSLLSRLLLAGAEIEARDKYERTPLLAVMHNHNISVAHELLKAGADVKVQDDSGFTALHIAIALGRPDMTAALINKGVDVSAREKTMGRTPMHIAAQSGQLNEVRRLMFHGADKNARDNNGRTPLHYAITRSRGAEAVARHLLDNGSDPLARDQHGVTPYDIAHSQRDDRLVEMFKTALRKQGRSYQPRTVYPYQYGYPPSWP